jgi:ABC-type nitrate/sulfonate/bicarbonate transport system ATPase subunit
VSGESGAAPVLVRRPTKSATALVKLRDLSVGYRLRGGEEEFVAVANATFDIGRSEMVAVVGPSGCGKSTVLSAVAGLMPYRSGILEVDGQPVTGTSSNRAVVFQKAALLPWITVEDNVAHGLGTCGVKKKPARERARELLKMVGLSDSATSAANFNTDRLFVAGLVISVLGMIVTGMLTRLERHFDRWRVE